MNIGTQYKPDDEFKSLARLFQSRYRAEVLQVEFQDYGNRLADSDAEGLLNYYSKLNSREALLIPEYMAQLKDEAQPYFIGCTFEKFISAIQGSSDFEEWGNWLDRRYIVR